MGAKQTTPGHEKKTKEDDVALGDEVNFNHFQALRSIGRGSFGKVCIVQKKDTKKLYAMKYASKIKCIQEGAIGNVLQEQQLLRNLEHPFIVNLRYSFQDVEDIFMVEDLLLGGDLRYHLQQTGKFCEHDVMLYVSELALALDYLQSRQIIHRDVKPDNVLLDEEGHAHLTDFNVATSLDDGRLATSQCGTQPYIAPEVFECAVGDRAGYSYPADWWSLGVMACELLKGKRPFEVPSSPTLAWEMFRTGEIHFSSNMSDNVKSILRHLICVNPDERLCSAASLTPFLPHLSMDDVLHKKIKPTFVPSAKQLNVDPTYELEELIIESKPIHKKKQRLAKVADPTHPHEQQDEHIVKQLQQLEEKFLAYNWEGAAKAGLQDVLLASHVQAAAATDKQGTSSHTVARAERANSSELEPEKGSLATAKATDDLPMRNDGIVSLESCNDSTAHHNSVNQIKNVAESQESTEKESACAEAGHLADCLQVAGNDERGADAARDNLSSHNEDICNNAVCAVAVIVNDGQLPASKQALNSAYSTDESSNVLSEQVAESNHSSTITVDCPLSPSGVDVEEIHCPDSVTDVVTAAVVVSSDIYTAGCNVDSNNSDIVEVIPDIVEVIPGIASPDDGYGNAVVTSMCLVAECSNASFTGDGSDFAGDLTLDVGADCNPIGTVCGAAFDEAFTTATENPTFTRGNSVSISSDAKGTCCSSTDDGCSSVPSASASTDTSSSSAANDLASACNSPVPTNNTSATPDDRSTIDQSV